MASVRSKTGSASLDMLPRSTDQNHIIGHSGGNTLVSKVTEAPPKAPGEEETGAWYFNLVGGKYRGRASWR